MRYASVWMLVVGLLVYAGSPLAQEWDQVSREELTMTAVPEDPEADAVVLFDKSTIAVTLRFELVIQRYTRIKILTERGLEYGNITIQMGDADKLEDLQAHAILPSGKKIELKKKDIFTQKRKYGVEKVFALPGVAAGTVIEYKYEISSKGLTFLAPWQFQNREFTRLSELTLVIPQGLNYQAFASNANVPQPTQEAFQIVDPALGSFVIGKFVWRAENLPAIKPEPYMTTPKDYFATLYFQIGSFQNPKDPLAKPITFIKTWDDLSKLLAEEYRPFLNPNITVGNQTQTLIANAGDNRSKAQILYGYVRDTVETAASGEGRKQFPADLIKKKRGNAYEKNMLLIAMLNAAGLKAHPVLISNCAEKQWDRH